MLPFLPNRGKSVVRFHGSDLYEEAKGFLPFRERLFPAIDMACPVSQHGADYLKNRYGALTPPVTVSRLGTKDWGINPEPITNQPFHLVSCAHIIPLKRIDLILEALFLLYRENRLSRPLLWTHIGEGALRNQFEKSVMDAKLTEKLTICFHGEMLHDDVMVFYKEKPVDLFISTSRSEGVPVSMMEALSFGIPVMATAVGGVPELVSDDAGCLLPANPTTEEIALRLFEYMELPPSAQKAKRKQARSVWENGWNADVNFKQFCTTLNLFLSNRFQ